MITILTEVWHLKLFHAVILTNVQEGTTSVLASVVACLANSFLGPSLTLILCALLYAVGLLLWFFTFPEPKNDQDKITPGILFYLGLVLITLGQCGYQYYQGRKNESVENDLQEAAGSLQEGNESQDRQAEIKGKIKRCCLYIRKLAYKTWVGIKCHWILSLWLVIAILCDLIERKKHLVIAASLVLTSAIFGVGNWFFCHFERPQGCPLVQVFQVFLAALKKRGYDTSGTCRYYGDGDISDDSHNNNSEPPVDSCIDRPENQIEKNSYPEFIDLTDALRPLNKVALYKPSMENAVTESENRRLYTVKQVEETKRFTKAIRLSSVFVMYGVLTAVGDTFFTEQANNMDTYFFAFDIPIPLIAYFRDFIKMLVCKLCLWILAKPAIKPSRSVFHGAVRVGLGMMLSVSCFVIAYFVEVKRLKTEKTISVFFIAPQLCLLGVMDGVAIHAIEDFFEHEMPESISKSYGALFAEGVVGVGKLLGCLWFTLFYFATKGNGKSDWFGDDINSSRLDKYYLVMAGFGFIGSIIYGFVALTHSFHQSRVLPQSFSPSDLDT